MPSWKTLENRGPSASGNEAAAKHHQGPEQKTQIKRVFVQHRGVPIATPGVVSPQAHNNLPCQGLLLLRSTIAA
eukprot:CAMPEP_0172749538 /NCGR_PEP_ID=MMETSP1074-20121228/147612_1 /TAXON_ID=2916 /ORGANISM="Ceratium fusus, Strain PA161109" /LENGTH=73 /DNA_ID=CAMNT_0013581525 /DNA_START=281 /DNA_END=498 /DNA_ORIENTATION=+